jgi:hypothetical protein
MTDPIFKPTTLALELDSRQLTTQYAISFHIWAPASSSAIASARILSTATSAAPPHIFDAMEAAPHGTCFS